jgi:Uncharacterised protein family (UPF0158)
VLSSPDGKDFRTAEIVSFSDVIEQMDLTTDKAAPQWQKELLPKAREVLASEDYISLPSKFEIHEWSIMERFAQSLTDAAVSDELDATLHGRGAFRRFKDAVHRLGIADEWYRFRDAALEEIAIEFLEAHGIAYQLEPRQK